MSPRPGRLPELDRSSDSLGVPSLSVFDIIPKRTGFSVSQFPGKKHEFEPRKHQGSGTQFLELAPGLGDMALADVSEFLPLFLPEPLHAHHEGAFFGRIVPFSPA